MGNTYRLGCSLLITAAVLLGCSGEKEDSAALTWQGETPHLRIEGRLNGEQIAIAVDGEEAASGSRVWCAREYEAPTLADGSLDLARAVSTSTEINGFAIMGAEERFFELELRQNSLQDRAIGESITIIPRDSAPPGPNEVWLDWEWHIGDEDLYEGSAQEGHLELELFSGAPGEGGVVIPSREGSIGGLLEARWSIEESLDVSFTLPCMATEVEGT